jgi:hypothetical protein
MILDSISALAHKTARGNIPRDQLEVLIDERGRETFRRADGRTDAAKVIGFTRDQVRIHRAAGRATREAERANQAERHAPVVAAAEARAQRLLKPSSPAGGHQGIRG